MVALCRVASNIVVTKLAIDVHHLGSSWPDGQTLRCLRGPAFHLFGRVILQMNAVTDEKMTMVLEKKVFFNFGNLCGLWRMGRKHNRRFF